MKLYALMAVALFASSIGIAAHADTPAVSISDFNIVNLLNPPYTLGYEFEATQALSADSLGIFDSGTGLVEAHDIGLFDSAGDLLASATLGPGTGTQTGDFLYGGIGPVNLTAGSDYYVGATYADGNEPLVFDATVTSAPGITYLGGTYAGGAALSAPTSTGSPDGYFGGTLTVSAAPEPSTWLLMIAGVTGIGLMLRQAKRRMGFRFKDAFTA